MTISTCIKKNPKFLIVLAIVVLIMFILWKYNEKRVSSSRETLLNILDNNESMGLPTYSNIEGIDNLIIGNIVAGQMVADTGKVDGILINSSVNCSGHLIEKVVPETKMLSFGMIDDEEFNMEPYLEPSFQFIDNALKNKEKVLVFCYAGKSRSATIVLYYMMKKMKSLDQAVKTLAKTRGIRPNNGFMNQLYNYAKLHAYD